MYKSGTDNVKATKEEVLKDAIGLKDIWTFCWILQDLLWNLILFETLPFFYNRQSHNGSLGCFILSLLGLSIYVASEVGLHP